ncbi:MAG: glycoside hydrolase family 26 protein [bacterium]|nr:glycoside hydrolase family 26 protein [bacterium]
MRIFLTAVLLFAVISTYAQELSYKANSNTRKLYSFLAESAKKGVLFGHQDDLAYGVGWKNKLGNSDVKLVTGDYPAVFGWDLGKIHQSQNLDSVEFDQIHQGIVYAYKMGGINTISWHTNNPVTEGNAWDKKETIKHILPGGSHHQKYVDKLDHLAKFIKQCKVGFHQIPIVFRPFHEHNGDWFWWGKPFCTEQEFIDLWRFTVDYLRKDKKLKNLIIAFSPDRSRLDLSNGKNQYLYGYPGDNYVDIIGLDDYWDVGHSHNQTPGEQQKLHLSESIALISQIALEKNKVAALTEAGKAGLESDNWFTNTLLNPIKNNGNPPGIAWMLVWRNANMNYFYVPYKGQKNEADFKEFEADPLTLFLGDIKNPYKKK